MAKRKGPKKSPPAGQTGGGFCQPPLHGQIKPGEVRNPWGAKGKPKPEAVDPFEFAASIRTLVTINGEQIEVSAETASHLNNMMGAVGGDRRAHKNVQDERRSRRRTVSEKTVAEALQDEREKEQKAVLTAKLTEGFTDYLNKLMDMKRRGLIGVGGGWSAKALAIFGMLDRGEIKIPRDEEDHDDFDAGAV